MMTVCAILRMTESKTKTGGQNNTEVPGDQFCRPWRLTQEVGQKLAQKVSDKNVKLD
jgi:hypothetical protein